MYSLKNKSQCRNRQFTYEIDKIRNEYKYTYIFEKTLQNDTNIEKLSELLDEKSFNPEKIDSSVIQLNYILMNAAKKSIFAQKIKGIKRHKKTRTQEWFNRECNARRKQLRQKSKDLSSNPFDKCKRQQFVESRSAYKKICRKAEKAYRLNLTKNLTEIGLHDPKAFWGIIKKMNNWGKESEDPVENITPKTWVKHFEGLLNEKNARKIDIHGGHNTFDPILDRRITSQELRDALTNLKPNKAHGPDGILGEYLKIFGYKYENILLKLIRKIFSEYIYPSKWDLSFIKPIHKKGKTNDPNNFRGLAIGSAFAKLFSLTLLKRNSNIGLKQGDPLSSMLFNLYIDDVNDIFDDLCNPIEVQNEKINHFLYADDLSVLSQSSEGLQRCLDKIYNYAKEKHLTISTKKSKTMIFNQAGKFLKNTFMIQDETLEPVQSFCYLGFNVKCSGTVKHAMNILCDKANKALRPLLCAIARFNIPVKTSIQIFHTYISPILLYNAENWTTLSNRKLQNFNDDTPLNDTSTSKIDVIHRKLLKFVLGVSKSCPNLTIYGETGEIPLSLKGYRLMLNFWHRVTSLPDTTLVRKAMTENIELRTNWIITIERLINRFKLADKIGNHKRFKEQTKAIMNEIYSKFWGREIKNPNSTRLLLYKQIKKDFKMENYLQVLSYENRKILTKIRCSDHCLEIEKGRHRNIPRNDRICKLCDKNEIETEDHFLLRCNMYCQLRTTYNIGLNMTINELFSDTNAFQLGKYLVEAMNLRKSLIDAM